jgi:hypothetical protein
MKDTGHVNAGFSGHENLLSEITLLGNLYFYGRPESAFVYSIHFKASSCIRWMMEEHLAFGNFLSCVVIKGGMK